MYRTVCVLALLTLQAGLAHYFSWDIVVSSKNRLEFYNEGNVTYSVTFIDARVDWITYDPFHNRVLILNSSRSLLSFDIATGKKQPLIDLKPVSDLTGVTYDPATGLLFSVHRKIVYSYLVTPGSNHEVNGHFVTDLGQTNRGIAVDSCGGYIYWILENNSIERARLNGSGREEVIGSSDKRHGLTIDPQTQNMYWSENYRNYEYFIYSANLNGQHRRTLISHGQGFELTVSKDFIYSYNNDNIFYWKYPKNLPLGKHVEPKQFALKDTSTDSGVRYIIANYAIEEQTQGNPLCKALKRLLPNYSETNHSNSMNVSTYGINVTKNCGESWVSDNTWNVSVCHNYCLQGHCTVSADGKPKCRCNVGYSGVRCEVDVCQTYCLHGGVCSLSEQNNPVCQCTSGYQGERCDVPDFDIKCSCSCSTVSLLKDILNADLTSVTEGKGVKSTCASTAV